MGITHEWSGTVLTVTSDSGTSSCDLKGEKGDDGARGAQGAQGVIDTTVLDNYARKFVFSIAAGETATITFTSSSVALITARGTAKQVRGTYLYSGYGIGGIDRVSVTELDAGTSISYSILEASESGDNNGITLTNSNTGNNCRVIILMLYGAEPTVTIETTTTE